MSDDYIPVKRRGRREYLTLDVTPDQLHRLKAACAEMGFTFHVALFCAAVFLTNVVNVLVVPLPAPGIRQTIFVSITIVSLALALLFGYMAYRSWDERSDIFREIEEQPLYGPMGDDTHEVRSTDLARLPLEPAPAPPTPPASAEEEVIEAAPAQSTAATASEGEKGK
jgi:hypothetical protein